MDMDLYVFMGQDVHVGDICRGLRSLDGAARLQIDPLSSSCCSFNTGILKIKPSAFPPPLIFNIKDSFDLEHSFICHFRLLRASDLCDRVTL